jgi:type III secretory pathway component EscS
MSDSTVRQLSLAPLGAGDLIDRAVRLYRRHLFILIRTAAPPVIVAALGGILVSIGFRQAVSVSETSEVFFYIGLLLVGVVIAFGGHLFTLVVMGGSTRNLVAHLLHNDPVSAKATYQAVRARFGGLVVASLIVLMWIGFSSGTAVVVWYTIVAFVAFGALLLSNVAPIWLCIIIGVIGGAAATVVLLWLFFFIAGRVAYVPQVMLVEGRGVFEAFSRSFTIARGNVRRLMAMTLFTTFATYSAMMILLVPLGWYGYLNGINPLISAQWPAWYQISYSVLVTLSSILLAPVWMLGLSLLYVDERVRHEGYDIELLAAQQLGEMPEQSVASPFGPALSKTVRNRLPPPPMSSGRVLNLR